MTNSDYTSKAAQFRKRYVYAINRKLLEDEKSFVERLNKTYQGMISD